MKSVLVDDVRASGEAKGGPTSSSLLSKNVSWIGG